MSAGCDGAGCAAKEESLKTIAQTRRSKKDAVRPPVFRILDQHPFWIARLNNCFSAQTLTSKTFSCSRRKASKVVLVLFVAFIDNVTYWRKKLSYQGWGERLLHNDDPHLALSRPRACRNLIESQIGIRGTINTNH